MEDNLKKVKMEDDLQKNENGRRTKKGKTTSKEDDLKKVKNGRQPKKIKWKTNPSTKINLIGCDTIVNSPN
jgi:hypothetical protein